ncbi:MAG: hypothetical protein PHN88_03860 [Ignavibacteria bacterium]|nr:hypothetical protein [Ignavibacteria bacterium]
MQNKAKVAVIVISLLFAAVLNAQIKNTDGAYKLSDARNKVMTTETTGRTLNGAADVNQKSPALSALLSLILPGAGHYYAGRMDVGGYFLGAEAAMWLGLFGVNYYGNILRDDSRSYASTHSGLSKSGKDDDYFSNVGSFLSIYDYNNNKLARGEYNKLYDINTFYWNWDSKDNMDLFDLQRKRSERTYNVRTLFITGMIINRLVSGISALILTNKGNAQTGGMHLSSEFTTSPQNKIDGLRLNFVKSF